MIPVHKVRIPEYHVRTKPDHVAIGRRIDRIIKRRFLGRRVAIRCLGSQEHKGKTLAAIVRIIKKLGTDRYSPRRKGDRYGNIGNKKIDFFALDFRITRHGQYMRHFIEPFYIYSGSEKGWKPVRIDIAIIYDLAKLRRVVHRYVGRKDIKRDGFVFKNPDDKPKAVKGIIQIR